MRGSGGSSGRGPKSGAHLSDFVSRSLLSAIASAQPPLGRHMGLGGPRSRRYLGMHSCTTEPSAARPLPTRARSLCIAGHVAEFNESRRTVAPQMRLVPHIVGARAPARARTCAVYCLLGSHRVCWQAAPANCCSGFGSGRKGVPQGTQHRLRREIGRITGHSNCGRRIWAEFERTWAEFGQILGVISANAGWLGVAMGRQRSRIRPSSATLGWNRLALGRRQPSVDRTRPILGAIPAEVDQRRLRMWVGLDQVRPATSRPVNLSEGGPSARKRRPAWAPAIDLSPALSDETMTNVGWDPPRAKPATSTRRRTSTTECRLAGACRHLRASHPRSPSWVSLVVGVMLRARAQFGRAPRPRLLFPRSRECGSPCGGAAYWRLGG